MVAEHAVPAPPGATRRADGLVRAAEAAVRDCGVDPRRADRAARGVLEQALARGDAEAACGGAPGARAGRTRARRPAAGRRAPAPGDPGRRRACRDGSPRRACRWCPSAPSSATPPGRCGIAAAAEPNLPAEDWAKLDVQRAVALVRLGRHGEAVRLCDRALAGRRRRTPTGSLRRAAQPRARPGLPRGTTPPGPRIWPPAADRGRAAGLDHLATLAEANLPFLAARRGDIPAAFARYRRAPSSLAGYPERLATMRCDLAEALVAAHLPGEARALLLAAVPELAAAGAHVRLAEARLLLAQVELLTGDPHRRAGRPPGSPATELAGQGRHAWLPLAERGHGPRPARAGAGHPRPARRGARLRGRPRGRAAGPPPPPRSGSPPPRLAAELGDRRTAGRQLDRVIAACAPGAGGSGPDPHARLAPRGGAAPALAGDRAGAFAAVDAGLREVAGRGVPAPDLRAHAVRPAEELAAFGLDLALRTGEAATVLAWAERWRACVRGRAAPVASPPTGCPARSATPSWSSSSGTATSWPPSWSPRACACAPLGSYRGRRGGDRAAALRPAPAEPARRRSVHGIARGGRRAGRLLLGPLARRPRPPAAGDRAHRGAAHAALAGAAPLRGRPVCVAASAAAWLAGRRGACPPAPAPGAARSWRSRARAWRTPRRRSRRCSAPPGARSGCAARTGAVLAALAAADVAHLAAHGMFSPAQPAAVQHRPRRRPADGLRPAAAATARPGWWCCRRATRGWRTRPRTAPRSASPGTFLPRRRVRGGRAWCRCATRRPWP